MNHHYVPVSILSNFASSDAWKLVNTTNEAKLKIASRDNKLLKERNRKHKWPLCVFDKRTKIFTRRIARKVCSEVNLYQVTDCKNPVVRTIMYLALNPLLSDIIKNNDELWDLSKHPLDSDLVERNPIAKIDEALGLLIPKLRWGQKLDSKQYENLLAVLMFARFRTPTWKRVYLPEASVNLLPKLRAHFNRISNRSGVNVIDTDFYKCYEAAIKKNQFALVAAMQSRESREILRKVNARIIILHTNMNAPFITCDNASRPYFPDRIRRMPNELLPGLGKVGVQFLFPIAPDCCVVTTNNPTLSKFSHKNVKPSQVRRINTALALMSEQEIILPEPHFDYFEEWLDIYEIGCLKRP